MNYDILCQKKERLDEMRKQLPKEVLESFDKNFYADMSYWTERNAVQLAAWTHAEFVKIHPYIDGNGRTSHMIMNYQFMYSLSGREI